MKRPILFSWASLLTVLISLLALVGNSRADIITWTNLSGGYWSQAANWDPNQVPSTNDTALITVAGTYTVRLDVSVTLSNLTLGGDSGVQTLIMNGANFFLSGSGTVASNGVLSLATGAFNSTGPLTVEGLLKWSGGTLGGPLNIASSGVLRTSAASGSLTYYGGAFNNAGTVDAQSGTLTFFQGTNSGVFNAASNAMIQFRGPGSPFVSPCIFNDGSRFTGAGRTRLLSGYITLNGTLLAQNLELAGGNLLGDCALTEGPVLWTGSFIQGTVNIPTNVVLAITRNVALDGGQLNNAGSVIWTSSSFIGLDFGGTINNSGTFDMQNDGTFIYNGGAANINNTGIFRKSAGTNSTTIKYGIALNNSGLVDVQSGTLSVNTLGANSGTFNAASKAVILFTVFVLNAVYTDTNGTFNAASNGLIIFNGGFSGSGTSFTGPGIKRFSGVLYGTIAARNLEVASGGSLGGNCTLTGGPIFSTGGGFGGNVTIASNVVLTVTANVIPGPNFIFIDGRFTNNGTVLWMSSRGLGPGYGARINNAGTFIVRSNLLIGYFDAWFFNSGLLLNEGGSNTITLASGLAFFNSGTVDVGGGTLVTHHPPGFIQTDGLLRLAGGSINGSLSIQAGALSGYGTISGSVTNSGTVSPGDPLGALTIIGSYTQTGELDIDLGGLAPGADYDQLIVTGRANLRGVLRVALNNGFRPALGDNFSVLDCGSLVGEFDCLIGANLGGGTKLLASYSPTNLVLTTTNGPVQTNAMAIFTCGARPPHLQFTGLPGQTYSIEATTNIVTVTNCVPDPCQILSRFHNWITVFRTNSPTGEIDFDDPDAATMDRRFYRARLEP